MHFVSISDWKMQKSLKTDYENLMRVYLWHGLSNDTDLYWLHGPI